MILDLLKTKHDISISLRNLERRLRDADLTRRSNYTPLNTVRAPISEELRGSGRLLGYRAMWQILQQKHSLVVRRDDVMHLMAELDPCGKENRCRWRFVRRAYYSLGPNEIWHVDGYDKLKPFGIAINGCILPKNDVAELWEDQQRPFSYCSDVRQLCSWVWSLSKAASYRLWHWERNNGSPSVYFEVRACRWVCRG